MNTPQSPHSPRRLILVAVALAAALTVAAPSAPGATITKDNNTTALNQGASWVGGVVPGAADIALWDATVTGVNNAQMGGSFEWAGIQVTDRNGTTTITGNFAQGWLLSLGTGGIDMSSALNNLTLGAVQLDLTANQVWNVGAGRTLSQTGNTTSFFGNFGITKEGEGQVSLLGGSSSFTGGININGGTLALNGASALLTGNINVNVGTLSVANASSLGNAHVTMAQGTFLNSTQPVTFAGIVNQTWNGNFTYIGGNTLNTGVGAVELGNNVTLTVNASVLTIGGAISGGFALTKAGAGTLVLSGANTFTGGLNIASGTVTLAGANALPGPINLGSGAFLNLNVADALGTSTLTIEDGATLNNGSAGALTLNTTAPQVWNGNFTYTGSQILNTGNGGVTLTGNRQVTVSASTLTVGGPISGTGFGIIKAGNGALTLTGTNTFDGGVTLLAGGLNLGSPTALGTGTLTINGGVLNTSGGAQTLTTNNAQVWNANVVFTGANSLNMGAGPVTLTDNRTVTVNGSNLTISGVISGAGLSLTKAGVGGLHLGGANTFDGGISLDAGVLGVNSPGALGTGILTINGGFLNNTSGAAVTVTTANAQNWNTDVLFLGTNSLNLGTGPVTLSANRTVTVNANTLTVGGVISGSGLDLIKSGAGALVLSGNNLYTGSTFVFGGTLSLTGNNAYTGSTFVRNATLVVSGQQAFTPSVNVDFGTLVLDFSAPGAPTTNILAPTSTLSLTNPTNVTLIGAAGAVNSQTFASTTLLQGLATVTLNQNGATSLGLNFGLLGRNTGSILALGSVPTGTLTYGTTSGTANSILVSDSGTPYAIIGGNDWGAKDATNTNIVGLSTIGGGYTNSTANSLAGNADIAAGIPVTVLSANTVISSLRYNVDQATTINLGGNTLGVGGILMTSAVNTPGSLIETGTLTSAGNGGDIVVFQNSAHSLTINATIADNITSVGLTKGGAGALVLNAANPFTGNTTVVGGTISLGNSLALQNSPVSLFGGSLSFGNLSAATLGGLGGTSNVTLDNAFGSPLALTLNTLAGVDVTLSGAVGGNGTLTKTGNGAMTLSGNNTFASGVTLNGGTLRLNSATAIGTGALIIAGPSFLDNSSGAPVTLSTNNIMEWNADFGFAGTNSLNVGTGAVTLGGNRQITVNANSLTVGGVISGSSSITKLGNGNLHLSAANLYTGGTTLAGGTLTIGTATSLGTGPIVINGGNIGAVAAAPFTVTNSMTWDGNVGFVNTVNFTMSGPIVLTGNRTLTVAGGNVVTLSGVISGANLSLTKEGPGTVNLTAANSFNGGITVNGGTVSTSQTAGLGTGPITFNSGTVITGNFGVNNAFNVIGEGTIIWPTTGGNANNNYAGAITGNGTLNYSVVGTNPNLQLTWIASMAGFNGTINLTDSNADFRFNNGGANTNTGSANMTLNLGTNTATIISRNGMTGFIGALFGGPNTTVSGSNAGPVTWIIGGKNTDSVFEGRFTDGPAVTSIVKVGNGTLTLASSASTNTGTTTINAGTLQIGNGGTTGGLGLTPTVVNNSTLAFNRSDLINFSTTIGGSGSIEQRGNGTLVITGNNSFGGAIAVNGGTLSVTSLGNAGIAFNGSTVAPLVANATGTNGSDTLTLADTSGLVVGDIVTGNGAIPANTTIIAVNPGNVVLSAVLTGNFTDDDLTFSNPTVTVPDASLFTVGQTVSGTSLQAFATITAVDLGNNTIRLSLPAVATNTTTLSAGTPNPLGLSGNATSNLVLNGGSFQYIGPTTSTDRGFTLGALGGGLDASGSGVLTMTYNGTIALSGTQANQTLVLSGNNTGNNTLLATLTDDGAGQTSLTKTGPGTWVLTANSTHSGPTTVNNGVLRINATMPNTPVTVTTNGTLTGAATFGNVLTVTTNGTVSPGEGVGNITAGSLVVESGARFIFEFANITSYDKMLQSDALGNLTLNGGGLSIYLEGTTTDWTTLGTYDLFHYNGTLLGNVSNLSVLNNEHPDLSYTFNNDAGNKTVQLIIAQFIAPFSWNVTGSGNWGTATNWSTNTTPNAVGLTASLFGAITANSTVTVDGDFTIGGLAISSTFSYTVAGPGNLTLDNGANATLFSVTSGNHFLNAPMILTAQGLMTNVTAGNKITLGGNISESAAASITIANNGIVALSGTNSFTGGVMLNSGILEVSNSSNLGAVSSPLVFNGGVLRWASGQTGDISDHPLTFTANGIFDTNGNTVTLANPIGNNGPGALVKIGNGILSLGGANTFTGGTIITGGSLELNSAANFGTGGITFNGGTLRWATGSTVDISSVPLTFNGSNAGNLDPNGQTVTLAGNIGNGSTGRLTKVGNGVIVLAGTNTYTGGTTVNSGTLSIEADLNLGPAPGAATPANIHLNGGELLITNNITLSANRGIALGPVGGSGNGVLSVASDLLVTYAGVIANAQSGSSKLVKDGPGQLNLTTVGTYSGGTELRGGTLQITATGLPVGTITFNGGTLRNPASLANPVVVDANGGNLIMTAEGAGLANTVAGSGTLSFNGTANRIDFGNSTSMANFNGTLSWGTSTATVRQFAGANAGTYTNVTVDLGAGGTFNVRDGGTLNLGALAGAGGFLNGNGTVLTNYNIGFKNLDTTFGGVIQDGNGSPLNKVGTGRMILTGANTYQGATTVTAGTLQIGNGGATGSITSTANINIAGNGTFVANRNGTLTLSNTIGGLGTLEQRGPGMLVLTGNNNFSAPLLVTGGTLAVNVMNNGGIAFNATNVAPVIASSTVVDTSTTVTVASTTGLFVGMTVGGNNNIPAGTRIVAVDSGNNTITLSQAATGNITGANLTYAGRLVVDDASQFALGQSVGGSASVGTGSTIFAIDTASNSIFPTQLAAGTDNLLALLRADGNGLGVATGAAESIILNGGSLGYVGSTDVSTTRLFTIGTAGGGLDASGTGTFTLANPGNLVLAGTDTPRIFNLSGTNTGNNTLASLLTDNGTGPTSLAKSGPGTWILAGNSTYTGFTSVSNGVLQINGNLSTTALAVSGGSLVANRPLAASAEVTGGQLVMNSIITGAANVTGSGVLTGPGTLNGALSVSSGGTISPGTGVGNTTVASAIFGEGANLTIEFATSTNDFLNVTTTDGLTLAGNVGVNLFSEGTTNPWTAIGTYNIVQFAGNVTGNVSELFAVNVGSQFPGLVYGFDTSGNFLRVIISLAPEPTSWNVAGGGNWGTLSNWFGAIPNASGAIAYFPGIITANSTVSVNGNFTVGGMQFSSPAFAYTVDATGANFLTLDNGFLAAEIQMLQGNATISAPMQLNSNLSANVTAGTALTLSGNIGENVFGTGVTKAGGGTLHLLGQNTFTGGLFLDAGTVVIGNSTASLGIPFGIVTFNGGALRWGAGSTADVSDHFLNFQANATLDTNGNNVTLANSIGSGGFGALIKVGDGILTLQGANSYGGGTFINGGAIEFSTVDNFSGLFNTITLNGGALRWATGSTVDITALTVALAANGGTFDTNGNNVTLAGVLAGNGSLTKTGNGALSLSGANTYTGGTNLNAGTLIINSAASLGNVAGAFNYNAGLLVLNGTFTTNRAYALNAAQSVFQVNPTFTVTLGGVLSGNGALVKTGNGILQVNAANTFTGGTVLNAGTVLVGAAAGTLGTGDVTFNGGVLSINSSATLAGGLNIPGNATLINTGANAIINGAWNGNGTLSMNGSSGLLTAAGSMAGFNGTLALGNSTGVFRFNFTNNDNTGSANATFDLGTGNASLISRNANLTASLGALTGGANTTLGGSTNGTTTWSIGGKNVATTFNGVIANGAATASSLNPTNIVKTGTGSFTVTGNNTYSGSTSINAGTLVISSIANGGLATTGTIANATAVLSVADASGLAVGMQVFGQNIPANATVVALDGTNVTISANATGNTTGAPVRFGTASNLGMASSDAANLVLNGGTLQYVGTGATSNRLFTLGLNNGVIEAAGTGALVLNNPGAMGLTDANVARTLTLTGAQSGNNTLAAAIGDNGTGATSLVKSGAGKWILSGNSTYTGTTSINSGRLEVAGSLGVTGVTVASGATLAGAGTIGGTVTLQTGAVMEPGASVGTITVAALAVSSGATLNFEFNTTPANDMIVVTDLNGLSINGASGFNLYAEGTTNPWLTTGTYNLFAINGTVSGNLGLLSALNAPTGYSYTLSLSGNLVQVLVALTQNPDSWNIVAGGSWGLNTNWTFNTVPANGANVTFGPIITATSTVTLDGSRTVSGVIFSSENGYTLAQGSSGTLSFNNGSAIQVEAGTNTISAPMAINTLLTANVSAATSLILSGNISETGAAGIVKNGPGLLTLSGTNSYTGGFTLNAGTVNANSATAFGTGTLVLAGGSLDNTSGSALTLSTNNVQLWNGNFSFVGTNDLNLGTGAVTLSGHRTVTVAAGNLTVGGAIGGAGFSLTKAGNGNLVLGGASSYDGGTLVNGGTLTLATSHALADSGAVTVNGGTLNLGANSDTVGAVTLASGSIVGTGTLTGNSFLVQSGTVSAVLAGSNGLTKDTAGTVTFSAANTYTGTTAIENGTLILVGGDNRLASGSAVTMGNGTTGGVLQLGDGAGASSLTLSGLTAGGTGTNRVLGGNATNSVLTLNIAAGANTFSGSIGDSTGNATAGNAISLVKTGDGLLSLSGVNTYLGTTNITAGTLQIFAASGLGTNVAGSNSTAVHIGNGTLFASGTLATNRTFFLDDPLSKIGVDATFTMTLGTNASLLGAGALNKEGAGTLILSGASGNYTYAGDTNVNVGTLTLGSAGLIPNASNLTIALGAFFNLNGNNDTVGNLAGDGGILLGNASLTANNTANTVFAGVIAGNGTLVKQGTGQLTLAGANTFTGTTTVSLGTLRLGNGVTDGSLVSAISLAAAGSLVFNNVGPVAMAGNISGLGSVTKSGAGELTLTGTNSYLGNTTVNAGTFRFNGALSSNISAAAGVTIAGTGTSNRTINLAPGARVAPGLLPDVIGNLTAASLTWNSDNTTAMLWDLNDFNATSDRLILTGNFIKGTGSVFLFDFQGTGYFDGVNPTTYTLVTFANNVGFSANNFVAINSPYGGIFSFVGNSLVVTVPEPSTWALLAGGAVLGLALLRKRRQRAAAARDAGLTADGQ